MRLTTWHDAGGKNSTAPAASTANAAVIAAHPQAGVPPGWLTLAAATVGRAEEAGVPAARGVAVCRAQAVAVDEEGADWYTDAVRVRAKS